MDAIRDDDTIQKEAGKRYSQMSEEKAAEEFEKRKQNLLQDLWKQHQQSSTSVKKVQSDKPPRHNSSKQLKNVSKLISSNVMSQSSNQFVVFNTQSKQNKEPQQNMSPQLFKKEASEANLKRNLQESIVKQERKKIAPLNQKENETKDQNIYGLKEMKKEIVQVPVQAKVTQKQVLQIESLQREESIQREESSPFKRPHDQSTRSSKSSKLNLLGDIGCLDLEIKRMQLEMQGSFQQSQTQSEICLQAAPTQVPRVIHYNQQYNKHNSPYYAIRMKQTQFLQMSHQRTQDWQNLRNSRMDTSQRSNDNGTRSGYSTISQKKKVVGVQVQNNQVKISLTPTVGQIPTEQPKHATSQPKLKKTQSRPQSEKKLPSNNPQKQLNMTLQFKVNQSPKTLVIPKAVNLSFSKQQTATQTQSEIESGAQSGRKLKEHLNDRRYLSQQKLKRNDSTLLKPAKDLLKQSSTLLKSLEPFEDRIRQVRSIFSNLQK